jgi:hypothetical protein
MGEAARKRAYTDFSEARMADGYAKVLRLTPTSLETVTRPDIFSRNEQMQKVK